MRGAIRLCVVLFSCCLPGACLTTESDEESGVSDPHGFIIRSDLPLWLDYRDQSMSPRHFSDSDSFGCLSELAFGDWKLTYNRESSGYVPDPVWWRVTNYGVMHCGAVFQTGDQRGANATGYQYGFSINLGTDAATGLQLVLWEIGLRTGSEYLILAAPGDGDGTRFAVLDPDCSAGDMRRADQLLSSWRTDYCAVPTQEAMRAIASEAATRSAIGVLEYVGEAPENPH